MGHPHKRVNGQLLQLDKSFRDLKMKQRDKIANWMYEAYREYVDKNHREPEDDTEIVEKVLDRIVDAGIWIPDGEIYAYYSRKKVHLRKRYEKESNTDQNQED